MTISHNTLVKNLYGVRVSGGTINVKNNIFSAAPRPGSFRASSIGIYRTGGTVTSTYNTFYNNAADYSGTVGSKSNDQVAAPRFLSADNNNYLLGSDSNCIGNADDSGNRGAYAASGTSSGILTDSYVATDGDDANNGSIGTPFRTVRTAMASTESNIYFRAGTYGCTAETTSSGQQLRHYLAEVATIDSGTAASNTINLGSNSTLDGISVNNTGNSAYAVYVLGNNAQILNNTIYRNGWSGTTMYFAANTTGGYLSGNTITNAYFGQTAIWLRGGNNSTTIESNTITADRGIYHEYETSSNVRIVSNKIIAHSSDSNATAGFANSSGGFPIVNFTIGSNEIRGYYNASGAAIYLGTSGGSATIKNNTIVKNTIGIWAVSGTSAGTYEVKNNIISAAPRPGSYLTSSIGINRQSAAVNSNNNTLYNNATNYSGTVNGQTNDATSCPRFASSDNNNYQLGLDSPCSGSADDLGNRGAYATLALVSGIVTDSYVATDGSDSNSGTIGSPFRTVARAIGSTESIVYLRTGTYGCTGETFSIGQQLKRYLSEAVAVDSGTANSHTISLTNNTTIDGVNIKNSCTSSSYYSLNVIGNNTQILNSSITREGANGGRAIYMANNTTGGTIRGNAISNTYATSYGIHMYGGNNNLTIESNTITADLGVYHEYTASDNINILSNKIISYSGNTSSWYGIYHPSGGFYLTNCTIGSNEVRGFYNTGYGALYFNHSSNTVAVTNNTLVNNLYGFRTTAGTYTLKNNIISNKPDGGTPTTGSIGVYNTAGTVTETYDDVWKNETNWSGVATGVGTISADPVFVSEASNNYNLSPSSPCIAAGTPEGTDMGAYDYVDTTAPTVESVSSTKDNGTYTIGEIIPITVLFDSIVNVTGAPSIDLETGATNRSAIYASGSRSTTLTFNYTVEAGDASSDLDYRSSTSLILNGGTISDEAGNAANVLFASPGATNSLGASKAIVIDTTAPAVPSLSSPANGSTTNESTPPLVWIPSTGAVSYEVRIDGVVKTTTTETNFTPTIALTDASHTWDVRAKDLAGNWSAYAASWSFTVDTVGPGAVALVAPADGAFLITATPTLTWEAVSSAVSYEVRIDGVVKTTTEATSYAAVTLTETSHTWDVRAIDAVGNWGIYSTQRSLTVDMTLPTISITAPTSGITITGETYSIAWTATDGGSGLKTTPVTISSTSNETWTVLTSSAAASGSYTWNVPTVESTAYRIKITAEDQAGNIGATTTESFTVNNASPTTSPEAVAPSETATSIDIEFAESLSTAGMASVEAAILAGINPPAPRGQPVTIKLQSLAAARTGTFVWSNGNKKVCFTPSTPLLEGESYTISVSGATYVTGGTVAPLQMSFVGKGVLADAIVPSVVIKAEGIAIRDGDYIDARPSFEVSLADNTSINVSSVKMWLDNSTVTPTTVSSSAKAMVVSYSPAADLADESTATHSVKAEVKDGIGNTTIKEVTGLKVATGQVQVLGMAMSTPATFSPKRDGSSIVSYSLNKSAPVALYFYGSGGASVVWTRKFSQGANGAKAGYNTVTFNGVSDISGTTLANGIYVYKIISNNKEIGKGYIVIYE
ncbi:MAG: Ig-like domain-containing protein [Candidatus Margulisiibacteriota bacterium]